MLQTHTLPAVTPAKCIAVGASLRVVKERVNNGETLIGWTRGSERDACPLGGLACYMVWLLDINGMGLLPTMCEDMQQLQQNGLDNYNPEWRKMYLLYGDNPFQPMSYTTHYTDAAGAMSSGKIICLLV